jgi:hypothetical protein
VRDLVVVGEEENGRTATAKQSGTGRAMRMWNCGKGRIEKVWLAAAPFASAFRQIRTSCAVTLPSLPSQPPVLVADERPAR